MGAMFWALKLFKQYKTDLATPVLLVNILE